MYVGQNNNIISASLGLVYKSSNLQITVTVLYNNYDTLETKAYTIGIVMQTL